MFAPASNRRKRYQSLPVPLSNRKINWLLLFLLLALAAFWPAREAGFVTDWIGGQKNYETGTYWQAVNNFGWRAMLPFMFLTNFTLFKTFGTAWAPWFLVFVSLHAANAWLLSRLALRWLGANGGPNGEWVALGTGLLFLLSPYAAEPIVWKACVHYQLALVLFFNALHYLLDYVQRPQKALALAVTGLFLVAIYLSEWAVVMPGLLLLATLGATLADGRWSELGRRLGWLVAPSFVLLAGWFWLNKTVLGHWAGHYGDDTHLNVAPNLLWAAALKYWAKYAFFTRYLRGSIQDPLYGWFSRDSVLLGAALLVAALAAGWVFFYQKINPRLRMAGLSLALFFGAILPVCNLFFYTLLYSENDRYGYFASGFFWLAALSVLAALPRPVFRVLVSLLVVVSAVLLVRTTRIWGQSEEVYNSLIRDFHWYDAPEVVMLATPDNLRGVYLARICDAPSGFQDALGQRTGRPYQGRIWEAVQFNMVQPTDGVKVEADSSGMRYKISFMQDGNWFWRNGIGAESYETDLYTLTKNEWDCTLTLKRKPEGLVLIYPVGGRWVQVK